MRTFPILLAIIIVLGIGAYVAITHFQQPQVVFPLPSQTSSSAMSVEASGSMLSSSGSESTSSIPTSVLIQVPFASQAPLQNWDAIHEEACEEASLILVNRYLQGQTITPQEMETEIQALVGWETNAGYAQDVTVEQLAGIAKDKYGLKATVMTDVSVESLKKELSSGHPVIIPAAGQMLGNPYYSGDGPPYHMLVVIGYNDHEFITNDVGTRRGKEYTYDQQTLINAIHDWTGSNDTIRNGKKAMLVLTK